MGATANGKDVLHAVIQEPRTGVWTAVVDVDSDQTLTGQVTLVIDGVTWIGTVTRGDLTSGHVHAQLVGGAGKLATLLAAKYYISVPLSVVLTDVMTATGERLSPLTSTAVTGYTSPRWARLQGKAGLVVKQLAAAVPNTVWRVLRDGTVWLGAETWPAVKPEYDETDRQPSRDSVTIAPESPTVAPGTMFLDKRVSRVTTTCGADGLRQEILFEADGGGTRVMGDVEAVIGAIVDTRIDLSYAYPAKVIRQASDGTLELLCDDDKMRGTGLTRVPIRHGIPGVIVKVPPGGKVLLMFEAGDQTRPIAALWPDGSSVTEIQITSPTIKIVGDLEVTGEVTALSANPLTKVTLSGHIHPTAMGPSDKPIGGM
jgi:hypothetical protein